MAVAEDLRVGDPREAATQIGPLVSQEHLDKVLSYIQLGQAEGAKLLTGGYRVTDGPLADGNYVAPTVFADVENRWRIAQEEIFGPVQVIAPFDGMKDSGIGREGGLHSEEFFTEAKAVVMQFPR